MKIVTTYHRPDPDTVTGHKIVLTLAYYSMDKSDIDTIEELFKTQYNSGLVIEYEPHEEVLHG